MSKRDVDPEFIEFSNCLIIRRDAIEGFCCTDRGIMAGDERLNVRVIAGGVSYLVCRANSEEGAAIAIRELRRKLE